MPTDPETWHHIAFNLDGEAFAELEEFAAAAGRTIEMQAQQLILKALGYTDYVPKKKSSSGIKPAAQKPTAPSRPTTAIGGLS